jgi:protein AATF/BFR2
MVMRQKDADRKKRKSSDSGSSHRPPSGSSLFAAVESLDAEDSRADRKRQRHHRRAARQSHAARSQMEVYWGLVECRILLQRSLARPLPPNRATGATATDGTSAATTMIVGQCDELLAGLLRARRLLRFGRGREGGEPEPESESDLSAAVLQAEYDAAREGWKEVLNRRQRDVKLRSGLTAKTQYRVLDSTFWQQVEATAAHELARRRRPASSSPTATSGGSAAAEFDDSKVYQQLLKDFVSSHHGASSQGSAAAAAAQDRLRRSRQASSQSSGARRDVDRKASKGRKIRYHDIPKLQHFAFPVARGAGAAGASLLGEDEWFRSLFGGAGGSAAR